jgi:hypothetical protein
MNVLVFWLFCIIAAAAFVGCGMLVVEGAFWVFCKVFITVDNYFQDQAWKKIDEKSKNKTYYKNAA